MVPNLRFLQFTDEWSKFAVSELLNTYPTNSLSWDKLSYIEKSKIKNIHYGLIHNGFKSTIISGNNQFIPFVNNSFIPKSYTLLQNGDLILADASEDRKDVGRPVEMMNVNNQKIISGLHTIHARNKTNLLINGFKGFYFQSYAMKKQIYKVANGSKIYGISPSSFNELFISVPNKEEQQKIVNLLQKIEGRIETQSKIIDDYISLLNSLRDHLIYTHNSKKATLSGYIDIYNGYTFKSKNYIKDGKYKVITISNVTGQRFVNLASINTINKIPFDIQNYQIIAKDSILVSLTGNVGRTSICNVDNCLLNQRVALVKCKNIDSKYIYHILSSTRFLRKMCLSSQGAAQKNISTKDILDYMIPLHSNQEIKNITRLLEAVESKLDIEKNILNFLYQQKTYLLKNMFI